METMILFPVVIGRTDLSHEISDQHRKAMSFLPYSANEGNHRAKESFILNLPEFANLKDTVERSINEYFIKNYAPLDDLRLRITTSWLNVTLHGEYHHKHHHANSAFSAVLYLNVMDGDEIEFYNHVPEYIKFDKKSFNIVNASSWILPVKKNELIIFPSWLMHSVPKKEHIGQRVSMAINTFYDGQLGNLDNLTSLKVTVGEQQ